jgi:hypothetical protein
MAQSEIEAGTCAGICKQKGLAGHLQPTMLSVALACEQVSGRRHPIAAHAARQARDEQFLGHPVRTPPRPFLCG